MNSSQILLVSCSFILSFPFPPHYLLYSGGCLLLILKLSYCYSKAKTFQWVFFTYQTFQSVISACSILISALVNSITYCLSIPLFPWASNKFNKFSKFLTIQHFHFKIFIRVYIGAYYLLNLQGYHLHSLTMVVFCIIFTLWLFQFGNFRCFVV